MSSIRNNIYSIFKSRFPETLASTFIETPDGNQFSYQYLEHESARIARFLSGQGINKGDRVAVQVDKSPYVIFLYLACLRAGFIYLPLNTAYTKNELNYFIDNAWPAVVVCKPEALDFFQRLKNNHLKHVFTLDTEANGSLVHDSKDTPVEFTTVACDVNDAAVILYTSGTTGQPKGALITHGNLAANGMALQQAWNWQRDDVLLHALPVFHIHGLFVACHSVLLGGSKMIFIPKFDSKTVIPLLAKSTVLMGVPTFYTRLLDDKNFTREHCRNMRLFISGSAPLLEQTFEEFKQRTGHTILERYGMTETGMNTSNPIQGDRIAGTVGLPLPGVEARIVNGENQAVSVGEVGILQIRGPNVFKGYWNMPEKTAEEFTADGFFITGDMAKYNEQGYISIVGRNKDMVISGGYNVYPKEVELLLDELDGVKESAVIGLPHRDFGEAVTAIIVPENMNKLADENKLIMLLKEQLASYKIPKKIIFTRELPRNTMGKVQKNILRDSYQGLYD